MPPVCVDASLVLNLLLPDEPDDHLSPLWSKWTETQTAVFGPPLIYAEVPSALRHAVQSRRISAEVGDLAFETFQRLGIEISTRSDLHVVAWALAKTYNQSRVYDAMYLAAAQAEGCELWTADRWLVNAVKLPWVRWIGEVALSG